MQVLSKKNAPGLIEKYVILCVTCPSPDATLGRQRCWLRVYLAKSKAKIVPCPPGCVLSQKICHVKMHHAEKPTKNAKKNDKNQQQKFRQELRGGCGGGRGFVLSPGLTPASTRFSAFPTLAPTFDFLPGPLVPLTVNRSRSMTETECIRSCFRAHVRSQVSGTVYHFVYEYVYDYVNSHVYDYVYDYVYNYVYDYVYNYVYDNVYDLYMIIGRGRGTAREEPMRGDTKVKIIISRDSACGSYHSKRSKLRGDDIGMRRGSDRTSP